MSSCSARKESPAESQEQTNFPDRAHNAQLLNPVAGGPLFAEIIDARVKSANLSPLNSKDLKRDDLEFRVWVGFGKKPLEGFVIERTDGQWKGAFLESMNATTEPPYRRALSSPKSGWEQLWSRLVDSGLLTLPDSSRLKGEAMVHDGTSYVVEVKKEGIYRKYRYGNPDHQVWEEARQILKIADALYTEFGVER
jgi:hypothetical protein